MDGRNIWKVRLYNYLQVRNFLLQRTQSVNPTNKELFAIAMRSTQGEKDTKIDDFNAIYAFSRTLLTTIIIGGILVIIRSPCDWKLSITIFTLIIILWLRCKQRSYYYAKEVLNVYSKINAL